MNVRELLEVLGELDPDAHVRLATQPAWPFEHHLGAVAEVWDEETGACTVFIGEGAQVGYLSGEARDEVFGR